MNKKKCYYRVYDEIFNENIGDNDQNNNIGFNNGQEEMNRIMDLYYNI